jgi:hypothetical protein
MVWAGDIVFHYSTPHQAFVGASVAGGPLEPRPIIWTPHALANKPQDNSVPVDGWWLPLYGYAKAQRPLTLEFLRRDAERKWIYEWIEAREKETKRAIAAPFQRYEPLRANQVYLAKMPSVFVDRWTELSSLVDAVSNTQEKLSQISEVFTPALSDCGTGLKFKNEGDYLAVLRGGTQYRTRKHEKLVRLAAEFLRSQQANVATPHPIDLLSISPMKVLFEAKSVGDQGPLFAIRAAVGQLLEYKHFCDHPNALLCILLDQEPEPILVRYVEDILSLKIAWISEGKIFGGPSTAKALSFLGILTPASKI